MRTKPKFSNAFQEKAKKAAKEREKAFRTKMKGQKMMPFTPQLSESVVRGKTVVSFRLHAYPFYPKPGQEFIAHSAHNALPGKYVCLRRSKCTLKHARDHYWKEIGLPSPAAYEELMREILHRPELELSAKGFLYVFERIE